jgi:hypothetical protein
MKLLCYKLLPVIMPTHRVKEVVKRPLVELLYKIITYGAIDFNAMYLSKIVFEMCGISRVYPLDKISHLRKPCILINFVVVVVVVVVVIHRVVGCVWITHM